MSKQKVETKEETTEFTEKLNNLADSQVVNNTMRARQDMRLQDVETQLEELQKKLIELFQETDNQINGVREAMREIVRRVDIHTQVLSGAMEDEPTPDED
tara:strand:+ start:1023 stop:1322 length:300 start_codon:yes stop_codon:yes gene_type:complete